MTIRSIASAVLCCLILASVVFGGDGPPSDTTQKFDMGTPHYIGVVDSVASDGSVRIAPPGGSTDGRARRPFTEGYYLGIVAVRTSVGNLFRVQVVEILTDDAIVVQVDADAAKQLKAGEHLALFRPVAATTAQLRAVPGYAPFVAAAENDTELTISEGKPLAASTLNLKTIGIGMHHFHDVHRRLPPAVIYGPDGKPWHSWRVLLLPFLDARQLYERYRFDEPWDGPNNSKLLDSMPDVYRDPVYGHQTTPYTNYAVVLGENTAFRAKGGRFDGNARSLDKAYVTGRSFREFNDGVSNTVLLVPVGPDQKIPWLKPADLRIDELCDEGMKGGFSAPHRTVRGMAGAFLMADGRPETILASVDRTKLRQLLTINVGQVVGDIFAMPVVPPPEPVPRLHIVQTEDGPVAKIVNELVAPESRQVDKFVPIQGPVLESIEASSIDGTWIVESHVEDGQKEERTVGDLFVFIADVMSIKRQHGGQLKPMYRYKVNAAANPGAIEMTSLQRQTTLEGIYKIEGNTLTMCIADSPDDDRPTEFKATKDWALFILKRHGTSP